MDHFLMLITGKLNPDRGCFIFGPLTVLVVGLLKCQHLKHASSSTDLEIVYNSMKNIIEVFQNCW